MTTAYGAFAYGTEAYGATPTPDAVSVAITAPLASQVLTASTLAVTWTYTSAFSYAEGWFRVRILAADSGLVEFDSGWIAGTATSYTPVFTYIDGAGYTVGVTAKNVFGVVSAEATVSISVNQSDPLSYPDCASVGSVYEIGINGVGYMLADSPDGKLRYQRSTQPLESQKVVTSSALFDEKVAHYSYTGLYDWSLGAGQLQQDREASDPSRFFDSDGVNVFEPFKLTLLHAVSTILSSAYDGLAAVASDKLYWVKAATTLTYESTPGGSTTDVALTAAQVVTDLCSDGQYWYAAHGGAAQGIARGTTAATLNWSAQVAEVVWFAGQRLCIAKKGATSSTPNVFSTLNPDGTLELDRLTLPDGWTISDGAGGGGFVYFGAYAGDTGLIYKWQAGSASAPSIAMELPRGWIPVSVFWYQGQVLVRAQRPTTGGGTQASILRCPVDSSGNLSQFRLVVLGAQNTAGSYGPGSFAADDRFVYFSGPLLDGTNAGVYCLDLASGGYARWFKAGAGGAVRSLFVWRGKVGFSVAGTGVVFEQDTYVSSGNAQSSLIDKASNLAKVFDSISVACSPLVAGETVAVDYTLDSMGSYTALPGASMSGAGQVSVVAPLGRKAQSIGMKVKLTGPGTSSPTVLLVSVRLHPLGLADTMVQLPVNCDDRITGLTGTELADNGPGAGARRARALEQLAQSRVKLQDIDWPTTMTSEVWEVIQVDVESTNVFDRSVGRNSLGQVAVLTLRKLAK